MEEIVVQSQGEDGQGSGSEGEVVRGVGVSPGGVGPRFYKYFDTFQLLTKI